MKTGFSLMEILHRENPVLITGEGFAVYLTKNIPPPLSYAGAVCADSGGLNVSLTFHIRNGISA